MNNHQQLDVIAANLPKIETEDQLVSHLTNYQFDDVNMGDSTPIDFSKDMKFMLVGKEGTWTVLQSKERTIEATFEGTKYTFQFNLHGTEGKCLLPENHTGVITIRSGTPKPTT